MGKKGPQRLGPRVFINTYTVQQLSQQNKVQSSTSGTKIQKVMTGYEDFKMKYASNSKEYQKRGIVALCHSCGEEMKKIQKDSRGIILCDADLELAKRGIAAICDGCNIEMTENEIAKEKLTTTYCRKCAANLPNSVLRPSVIIGIPLLLLIIIIIV